MKKLIIYCHGFGENNSLDETEKWYNMSTEWGRPTFSIVKVEADGNVYVGAAWNCFECTIDKNKNLELAEDYWKYEKNNIREEPIVEVLVNGKIKVIEIVKENKDIKQAEKLIAIWTSKIFKKLITLDLTSNK